MGLTLENIHKVVGGEMHLKDIHLEFAPGSRNVILGRTLAGKTSLLRVMAGLDRPTSGRVRFDGKDVTRVPVRKRGVAMVYQLFINYPSLSVYENIASPLKTSKVSKSEIDQRGDRNRPDPADRGFVGPPAGRAFRGASSSGPPLPGPW